MIRTSWSPETCLDDYTGKDGDVKKGKKEKKERLGPALVEATKEMLAYERGTLKGTRVVKRRSGLNKRAGAAKRPGRP